MRRSFRLAWIAASLALAQLAAAQDAAALRARHDALRAELADNAFGRPLWLASEQRSNRLAGEVVAVVEQPFAEAAPALLDRSRWCDLLILHLNVKYCRARPPAAGSWIDVAIGRKHDQPLDDAYPIAFAWQAERPAPDYLSVRLQAEEGPLYTSDYRLVLEAAALDERRSLLHLSYSCHYGVAARLALQAYLATLARDKVGFSVIGRDDESRPLHVGGLRGIVERNTMRYYLAIEAYLAAAQVPPGQQAERRLRGWIDAVERYPLQLHEIGREEYLAMKRGELARQQSVLLQAN